MARDSREMGSRQNLKGINTQIVHNRMRELTEVELQKVLDMVIKRHAVTLRLLAEH